MLFPKVKRHRAVITSCSMGIAVGHEGEIFHHEADHESGAERGCTRP